MHLKFLIIAITLCVISYLDNLKLSLFLVLIICAYYFFTYRTNTIIVLLILVGFTFYFNKGQFKSPDNYVGNVIDVKDKYAVVTNNHQKIILYNVEGVNLYDVISFEGKYQPITSNSNFNAFNYANYAKHNDIYYSLYARKYQVLKVSNSVAAKLYNYIKSLHNETLMDIFYHQRSNENYFIFAGGLHLSYLISLISKSLQKDRHKTAILISIVYWICFGYQRFLLRIFIFSLVPLLFPQLNTKENLGISIIACLFEDKNFIYDIGFIYSVAFRLYYCFALNNTHTLIKRMMLMFLLQLITFNHCNLVLLLGFNLIRTISAFAFIMALISCLLPNLLFFLSIIHILQNWLFYGTKLGLLVIGKPPIWWSLFYLMIFIKWISNEKLRFVSLILLVVYQCNLGKLSLVNTVSYIDVGQGDCILIEEAFGGDKIMIDVAGKVGKNVPEEVIYPYLESRGIKQIDKLIITHDDYDHSGGYSQLDKLITIKEAYREVETIKGKQIRLINLNKNAAYFDKNDNGIVLLSRLSKLNYLFMADAGVPVEETIKDQYNRLTVDILKVSHHGSKSGSSSAFIKQIHPKIAIISSGLHNAYGHPHQEVLTTLKKNKALVLNTQYDGAIMIKGNALFNYFMTSNGKFGIINSVIK